MEDIVATFSVFQSTPLLRGATDVSDSLRTSGLFQSTPLLRGATVVHVHADLVRDVSIHAPLARGDIIFIGCSMDRYVSIHAPLARGDFLRQLFQQRQRVSIHAPLARGDFRRAFETTLPRGFNPRPSCEGRPWARQIRHNFFLFQSTPLLRGATLCDFLILFDVKVSIHAPLARGDGGTLNIHKYILVSIHAPLARGDYVSVQRYACPVRFNPRPSCEGRLSASALSTEAACFNPRPSCEGRLSQSDRLYIRLLVSIHAPLARGDEGNYILDFNGNVSIHAPLARGDSYTLYNVTGPIWFQSTPLLRGATAAIKMLNTLAGFNPRPSCEGRPIPGHILRPPRPSENGFISSLHHFHACLLFPFSYQI